MPNTEKPPAAPAAPAAPQVATPVRSPRSTVPDAVSVDIVSGPLEITSERVMIYGPGGVGKTTLAAFMPGVLFFDLQAGSRRLNVSRDTTVKTWSDLRGKIAYLTTNLPEGVKTVVIDTATQAEELAKEQVITTRKDERNGSYVQVDSVEGFGWGKGWQFVYDEFCGLLADLDRLSEQGCHVVMIAHDCTSPVPNPEGTDYIRYEPHLYKGDKNLRGSVREHLFQWADHVLFINYDKNVSRDGKAEGYGSRTIYPNETATHRAKSRALVSSMPYTLEDPGQIWRELGLLPQ